MHTRALFLCPALDAGGAESHWASLLPQLASRGMAIRLVAIGGGGRALEQLRQEQIPTRELGAGGLGSLGRIPSLLTEARHHPDVVVTWGYNAHALGAAFARLTRTPQIVNWHRQPDLPMTRRQRWAVRFAARTGAGVIAVTRAQLPELYELGFRNEQTRVIPNGVHAAKDAATRAELRRTLGISVDAFVAVLVARMRPEKRIADFLGAMAAIRAEAPGAIGIVVGDGPLDRELRQQAKDLGAPVRFAGFQADPRQFMIAADVVCLTSGFEALPMVLVEAASCGRACVATDVGGTDEIIAHDENGLLVGVGDVDGIADALRTLFRDPGLGERMGQRGLKRWREAYSFNEMLSRYEHLLSTVIGPPTRWPHRGIAART
jgi:glycosyltransferase involved in cell wall biosynthesis